MRPGASFRGLFGRSPDELTISGRLEIDQEGEVFVDLFSWAGDLFDKSPVPVLYGELAEAESGHAHVTLFDCLATGRHWGTGGPLEKWFAHRALFGNAFVAVDEPYREVRVSFRELGAFLGDAPEPLAGELSDVDASSDGWRSSLLWRRDAQTKGPKATVEVRPFFSMAPAEPMQLGVLLSSVTPVIEGILSVALRRRPKTELTELEAADGSVLRLVGSRVDRPLKIRDVFPHDLLFRLKDVPSASELMSAARRLFHERPNFGQIFLSYERAPPTFVEDRVRGSITSLMHLTDVVNDAVPEGLEPSASLRAVPQLIEGVVHGDVERLIGMSGRQLAARMTTAYRWAVYRQGAAMSGRELLSVHHQLRAVIHLLCLAGLGFDEGTRVRLLSSVVRARGL